MSGWSYKDFSTQEEIDTFVRVKRRSMRLAQAARFVAAEIVGGTIGDGNRSAKEFVRTRHGLYRLCNGAMTDNSTEAAAHIRMGVKATIFMGYWEESMEPWLRDHGVTTVDYDLWFRLVSAELRSRE